MEASSVSSSMENRYENAIVVKLEGTKEGLGIKIVGGRNLEDPKRDFGIYIKDIVPGYLAHKDGKLQIGDQILKANNQNLIGVSNEKAVDILRMCASTNTIQLIVARDTIAKAEYRRLSSSTGPPTGPPSKDKDMSNQDSNVIQENVESSSSPSSVSVSYTSDSSEHQGQDEVDHVQSNRPLSAISTASGPPPPLPTSPPPDEHELPDNSPLKHVPTSAETALSNAGALVAELAAKRKAHSDRVHTDDIVETTPSPPPPPPPSTMAAAAIVEASLRSRTWTGESMTPSTGTPTRAAYYTLPSDAPNIYFKSSGSNPKLADKRLTQDDITKLAKTDAPLSVATSTSSIGSTNVQQRPKREGVSSYHHKRLSVNPSNRFKFEKLIMALSYIGYTITSQQKDELANSLDIDEQGKVVYEEFVKVAQKMFTIKLDEMQLVQALRDQQKLSLTPKPLPPIVDDSPSSVQDTSSIVSYHENESLALPQPPPPTLTGSSLQSVRPAPTVPSAKQWPLQSVPPPSHPPSSHPPPSHPPPSHPPSSHPPPSHKPLSTPTTATVQSSDTVASLKEVNELKNLLLLKDKEIAEKNEDNKKLKAEMARLKELHEHERAVIASGTMGQKLAVLDCELRKKKDIMQRYQVATGQLCRFVENCHNVLANSANQLVFHPQGRGEFVSRGDPVGGNPRPPVYLAKHARKTGPGLAQEARDTLTTARQILNIEELPDGWEEQYNKDGDKYYINHADKSTSWTHPGTKPSSIETTQNK